MKAGGYLRHWRGFLVAAAGILSSVVIALALMAPAPAPSSGPALPSAMVGASDIPVASKPAWPTGSPQSAQVAPVAGTAAADKTVEAPRLPRFRRGVNLSRQQSFSRSDPARPGYYLWPPFDGDLAHMSDAELDRLVALGFDFVRLPVDAGPFLASTDSDEQLLLDDLRQWVVRLQGHGLSVLVDIHPATYSSVWRPADILADPHGEKFLRYRSYLVQVAGLLAGLPGDNVALELMNEPQPKCVRGDGEDWTVSQRRLFKAVRAAAPSLALVLTGGCWSSVDGLVRLDPAAYDGATLYDFHFYEPYYFTHQSLPWSSPPARYLAGLSYPATSGSIDKTLALTKAHLDRLARQGSPQPADAFAAAKAQVDDYYGRQKPGPDMIERRFDTVSDWAETHGIAPDRIVLGEFSAIRWPQDIPDDGSRLRWLKDVREAAERHGFGWALWDYTKGFGLLSDNASRTVDAGTAEALGLETGALER